MILIRELKKEDFEQYFKLEQAFMRHDNSMNRLNQLEYINYNLVKSEKKKYFLKTIKKRNEKFICLEANNKIVGYFHGVINKQNKYG